MTSGLIEKLLISKNKTCLSVNRHNSRIWYRENGVIRFWVWPQKHEITLPCFWLHQKRLLSAQNSPLKFCQNFAPQVFVHCATIFQRICMCHTISESWDQALSGIEAHLSENSATNEKSAPEKWNLNMPNLLMSNSDQKSYFLKKHCLI